MRVRARARMGFSGLPPLSIVWVQHSHMVADFESCRRGFCTVTVGNTHCPLPLICCAPRSTPHLALIRRLLRVESTLRASVGQVTAFRASRDFFSITAVQGARTVGGSQVSGGATLAWAWVLPSARCHICWLAILWHHCCHRLGSLRSIRVVTSSLRHGLRLLLRAHTGCYIALLLLLPQFVTRECLLDIWHPFIYSVEPRHKFMQRYVRLAIFIVVPWKE